MRSYTYKLTKPGAENNAGARPQGEAAATREAEQSQGSYDEGAAIAAGDKRAGGPKGYGQGQDPAQGDQGGYSQGSGNNDGYGQGQNQGYPDGNGQGAGNRGGNGGYGGNAGYSGNGQNQGQGGRGQAGGYGNGGLDDGGYGNANGSTNGNGNGNGNVNGNGRAAGNGPAAKLGGSYLDKEDAANTGNGIGNGSSNNRYSSNGAGGNGDMRGASGAARQPSGMRTHYAPPGAKGLGPQAGQNARGAAARRYSLAELEQMTTHQLRSICHQERIVKGVVEAQSREELVRIVLKYRGADESLFIDEYEEQGFERLEYALQHYLNTPLRDAASIHIPAKITIYNGLPLGRRDGYQVRAPHVPSVCESNVLIVNEQEEVCGILRLVKDGLEPGVFMLCADKNTVYRRTANRNYSLLLFRKQDSEYLYKAYYSNRLMPPANLHYWRMPVSELDIREVEQTQAVLAIDFGTSNTTAGAFLDYGFIAEPSSHDILNGKLRLGTINYVSFAKTAEGDVAGGDFLHSGGSGMGVASTAGWIEMLPTAIGVADCADMGDIKYTYGYEAMRQLKHNAHAGRTSVFLGMKRWVNGIGKMEEVSDASGNTAVLRRSELIRAYLLHVIQTAEHQFKCRFKHLHFTSPVKLKEPFMAMFQEVLDDDYVIETEHALDEGMAVLYNTIADQIEQDRYMEGETFEALVIDCGGGTTDLSSCRFRIEEGRISYNIDIRTAYENGDTNFGGNNLTYRVMQYIKIVFADYYARGRVLTDLDELIGIPGADLFRHVDEYGVTAVYEPLEQRYREAERVLPTRFKQYENRTRDDYWRVRRNFYFLWELAEELKVAFFRRTSTFRRKFEIAEQTARSGRMDRGDNDLEVMPIAGWCLSLNEGGRFTDRHDSPDAVFTVNEMSKLLRADIYNIVRAFLEDFYEDGRLQQYAMIKLTGQSCRIEAFREALKEFVPGRSIEFGLKADEAGKVPELKLACLRGAIRYLTARKLGQIQTTVTRSAPVVPYTVTAYTHQGGEKVLISSMEQLSRMRGAVSRLMHVSEVAFYLKSGDDKLQRKYVYDNSRSVYNAALYEEIAALYGEQIPQEETDLIVNGEVKFFVVTGENQWGFHIVPVARMQEQLLLGEKRLFTFEDDLSELDFFDGLK
ncbi:molecular chaperone [Paenibacillus sp. BIHB 4019]|nr:molecular chaperone [Paenibacillus sp. BIHB 4019]